MSFNASVITAVQNRVNTHGVGGTTMGLHQAMAYVQSVRIPGQTSLTGGNVQVAGASLTNLHYQQLYEMLF